MIENDMAVSLNHDGSILWSGPYGPFRVMSDAFADSIFLEFSVPSQVYNVPLLLSSVEIDFHQYMFPGIRSIAVARNSPNDVYGIDTFPAQTLTPSPLPSVQVVKLANLMYLEPSDKVVIVIETSSGSTGFVNIDSITFHVTEYHPRIHPIIPIPFVKPDQPVQPDQPVVPIPPVFTPRDNDKPVKVSDHWEFWLILIITIILFFIILFVFLFYVYGKAERVVQ